MNANDRNPTIAWIALTDRCNLLCAHCPRRYIDAAFFGGEQEMSDDCFRKIEKDLFPRLRWLQFGGNNLGEQLLYSRWEEVPKTLEKYPDISPSLITNGTLLTRGRLEALVQRNWKLAFSLEAGNEETYRMMRGKSFSELKKTISEACEFRGKVNSSSQIHLNFAIFHENAFQLLELIEFASQHGIDQITVSHLIPVVEEQRFQSLLYHRSLYDRVYREAAEKAEKLHVLVAMPRPFSKGEIRPARGGSGRKGAGEEKPKACYHPWRSVSINPAGDVMPCCATSAYMGNLAKGDLMEIWQGSRYRTLRRRVNSRRPPSYCRNCVLRGAKLDEIDIPSNDERVLISRIGGIGCSPPAAFVERIVKKDFVRRGLGRWMLTHAYQIYRKKR